MGGKIFTLRNILFLLLFLGILVSVVYKHLEYQTLAQLKNLYASTVSEELYLTELNDKLDVEAAKILDEYLDPELDESEASLKLDELLSRLNLAITNNKNYINTLEKNRERYNSLNGYAKIIVGKRGQFIRDVLSLQDKYYEEEISVNKESAITIQLLINIFNVGKDKILLSDYTQEAFYENDPDYYSLFSNLYPLEKYTRSDYQFPEQDEIRKIYPYGYEALERNKNYMSSYYSVAKDFAAGDLESANYKISRVVDTELELNVDFDRVFEEYDKRGRDSSLRILETGLEKISLIKNFESGDMSKYPFVEPLTKWIEDVELCQLYAYKSSLYSSIIGDYPEAKTFQELLEELKKLSPQSTELDGIFDKSTIVFDNGDEIISFRCKEHLSGKEYLFQTLK